MSIYCDVDFLNLSGYMPPSCFFLLTVNDLILLSVGLRNTKECSMKYRPNKMYKLQNTSLGGGPTSSKHV